VLPPGGWVVRGGATLSLADGEADGDPEGAVLALGRGDAVRLALADELGPGLPPAGHVWASLNETPSAAAPVTTAVALISTQPAGVRTQPLLVPGPVLIPPAAGAVRLAFAMPSPSVSKFAVMLTKSRLLSGSTKTQTSWPGRGPPPAFASHVFVKSAAVVGTLAESMVAPVFAQAPVAGSSANRPATAAIAARKRRNLMSTH
jgi:hypothetical protein